jgi:tetratricopeptide (TPR) repeat protein
LLEAGAVESAAARFTEARDLPGAEDDVRFAASMGLAECRRRQGDLAAALALLSDLDPPDEGSRRWWLEARARLHTEAEDGAAAVEVWAELVDAAGDDPAPRTSALRGEADAWLAQDAPDRALPLYDEAAAIAPEPAAAGWARLGAAQARAELGEIDAALASLSRLRAHPDPEVALQAALFAARLYTTAEDWAGAIDALDGVEAADLGPGWDASIIETRAAALAALERTDAAQDEWRGLAARWPDSDEALLPAWLGLAELARMTGDLEAARRWARQALDAARDPGYRDRAEDLVAALDAG